MLSRAMPRLRRTFARARAWPPIGAARFADLGRTTPFDRRFGRGRGLPIDRYYIEGFLAERGADADTPAIRGRVLEIKDDTYARRFGDSSAIDRVDVLDLVTDNPRADFVADLADAPQLPSDAFDCVICTQTLLLIYDVRSAVGTLYRILKPGGILLLTVPGIAQISRSPERAWDDHWRFTDASVRRLLAEYFPQENVSVHVYGNVKTASAFLYGLAVEDLSDADLRQSDPDYQLIIAASAVK